MGSRQFGRSKGMHFLWMAQDSGKSSVGDRSDRSGMDEPGESPHGPPHAAVEHGGRTAAGKWLVPVSGTIAVLLVIGFLMYLSRLNELDTLEKEVSTLRAQSEAPDRNADIRAELDRQAARIEGLATRLEIMIDDRDAATKLRQELSRHSAQLATMATRLDQLEQGAAPAARPAAARDDQSTRPAEPAEARAVEPMAAQWAINLVAVADPASARQVERRLDELGVDSRIDQVEMDRRSLRRIVVPGFNSYQEAKTAASRLQEQLGLAEEPWIARE